MCKPESTSVVRSSAQSVDDFLASATNFLERNAKRSPRRTEVAAWGVGSESVMLLEELPTEAQTTLLLEIREWRATEFNAGFGWLSGPVEFGGRARSVADDRAYQRLRSQFEIPSETCLGVSLGMVAPTILAHGTAVVKHRYLRRLFAAEIVACQLFSEPGAGSDLASITTRADRVDGGWLVTGQKVWTSGAHYSQIGELLCRTNPDRPTRQGSSVFVIDMAAPGVTIRPLRQMSGGTAFNEVFLDEVFVPDDHLLGNVNEGWTVAMTTLSSERRSIGGGGAAGGGGAGFARVRQVAEHVQRTQDPLVRQRLADLYITMNVARFTTRRLAGLPASDRVAQTVGSIAKLLLTANQRRISDLVGDLLGPAIIADTQEWGTYTWAEYVLSVPGIRLAGGTDEIQRNTIAERGLGLPKH